jgi:AcrR family transcriptional regulator
MLDAALELLVEVGYDRMSIDAIAARAHASKATFYRRWANKAEVVAEALRRTKARFDCGSSPDTGTLRGDLIAKIQSMCHEFATEDGALLAGIVRAMRTDRQLADLVQQQFMEAKLSPLTNIVERAIRRDEIGGEASGELLLEVTTSMVLARTLFAAQSLDVEFTQHLVDDVLLPLLGVSAIGSATVARKTAAAANRPSAAKTRQPPAAGRATKEKAKEIGGGGNASRGAGSTEDRLESGFDGPPSSPASPTAPSSLRAGAPEPQGAL